MLSLAGETNRGGLNSSEKRQGGSNDNKQREQNRRGGDSQKKDTHIVANRAEVGKGGGPI